MSRLRFTLRVSRGDPLTNTSPPSLSKSPVTMDMVVVFPAPLGPRRPYVSPSPMLNPTPFMATRSPKALRKSRQTSTGLSPPPDTELPLLHSVLAFNRPGIYITCTCSHERSWKHTRCTVRGGPPGGCTAHLHFRTESITLEELAHLLENKLDTTQHPLVPLRNRHLFPHIVQERSHLRQASPKVLFLPHHRHQPASYYHPVRHLGHLPGLCRGRHSKSHGQG